MGKNSWNFGGMTEELAYILGVLKGDGSVSNTYQIELTQVKKEFAESFKIALEKIGFPCKIHIRLSARFAKKPQFRIHVRSKDFVNWYRNLSLAQIKELVGETPQFVATFIRGFYESDGYVRIRQAKKQTTISFHKSKELLQMAKELLAELGFVFTLEGPWECDRIKFGGRKYHEIRYVLQTTRKAQIQPFFQIINPCIKNPFMGQHPTLAQSAGPVSRGRKPSGEVIHPTPGPAGAEG